jgi:prefoldin alpha subunit
MADEKEVRRVYTQLQMTAQRMRKMETQLEAIQEKQAELDASRISVLELGKTSKNQMLVPVVDGIFARGTLTDTDSLIVNVGAGVCVVKSIPDAGILLQEKIDELSGHGNELLAMLQQLAAQSEQLEKQLGTMLEESA